MDLTHASFFSGVGGLDLGLERAGWRTVSFSEIDPYASAVLAERWPGVVNLGDIVRLAGRSARGDGSHGAESERDGNAAHHGDWTSATLWSGGFPCQDLSVAGKRAGFGLRTPSERGQPDAGQGQGQPDRGRAGPAFDAATRSGLAFAFLDLVERHRPPAILLENVPGLLSSHGGKDFAALLSRLAELGYWWAYRILDAQYFGVPQRRRRVFICALHAGAGFGADSAAAVLSVGSRCDGHSAAGDQERERTAIRPTVGALSVGGHVGIQPNGQDAYTGHIIPVNGSAPDASGVRAADGLAGRLDDSVVAFTKRARAQTNQDDESWGEGVVMPTLNAFDVGDTRTTAILLGDGPQDDPLLPLGLDSHRYRCCGNGVVAPVAEWVGERLRWAVEAAP